MKVGSGGLNMTEKRVYGLRSKDVVFQPSKCAEGWGIYLSKQELKMLVDRDREYWDSLELGIKKSTKCFKLFRDSLVVDETSSNKGHVYIAPRQPRNRCDSSGYRPESSHHTYCYIENIPKKMTCSCRGNSFNHAPNPRLYSPCPHIYANMIAQSYDERRNLAPFTFEKHPEIIPDVLKLHHNHSKPYYEIDAFLFDKYKKDIISNDFMYALMEGELSLETHPFENIGKLEKLLNKKIKKSQDSDSVSS